MTPDPTPVPYVPARGIVLPSREDPVARAASTVIGGPAGNRLASASGFWRALPVLILLAAAVFSAGIVQKAHCRNAGWSSPDQFWHACYSDIPLLYSSVGLGKEPKPGLRESVGPATDGRTSLGQPPLTSAAMWTVGHFVEDDGTIFAQRRMFDASAAALAAALFLGVAAIGLAARRRPWDAAHLALSPLLVTSALISYDLLAVALLAVALLAWTRERPLLAGVFLGLATTARPVSFAVACVVLLLALRTRQWSSAVLAFAGSVLTIVVVRAALLPSAGSAISDAWTSWKNAGASFGSPWLVPSLLAQSKPARARWWYTGAGPQPQAVTVAAIAVLVLVALLVVWLITSGRHQPSVGQLALIAVAGTLIAGKALPPQASVILLPLIALAALRWRDHLIWVSAELLYFIGVWLYLGGGNRGVPPWLYMTMLVVRLLAIAWLIRCAVVAARLPQPPPRHTIPDGEGGEPGLLLLGEGTGTEAGSAGDPDEDDGVDGGADDATDPVVPAEEPGQHPAEEPDRKRAEEPAGAREALTPA